jgi:hypothetical protein
LCHSNINPNEKKHQETLKSSGSTPGAAGAHGATVHAHQSSDRHNIWHCLLCGALWDRVLKMIYLKLNSIHELLTQFINMFLIRFDSCVFGMIGRIVLEVHAVEETQTQQIVLEGLKDLEDTLE